MTLVFMITTSVTTHHHLEDNDDNNHNRVNTSFTSDQWPAATVLSIVMGWCCTLISVGGHTIISFGINLWNDFVMKGDSDLENEVLNLKHGSSYININCSCIIVTFHSSLAWYWQFLGCWGWKFWKSWQNKICNMAAVLPLLQKLSVPVSHSLGQASLVFLGQVPYQM